MTAIERIYRLMETRGISGVQLQKACGLPNSAIATWKAEKAKPSAEALTKMADYFNVSVDYLLGRPEYPEIRMSNTDIANQINAAFYDILEELGFFIDDYRALLDSENFNFTVDKLVYIAVKMLATTTGCLDKIDPEHDYLIVLEKGSEGFEELLKKCGIELSDFNVRGRKTIKKNPKT